MKNLVQELMDSRPDWLDVLETEYKIKAVHDNGLVSLKYNQIESPMHEPIVQQCRGMVVHVERKQVLARPYDKFWNHGDTGAAEIDWSTARVQEKLDGSLMILYWLDDGWNVASSGTPRAGGTFGADERTFRDAFWQTFESLDYGLPSYGRWGDACFMFELCDAPNRVVVRHEKPRLVLHGVRLLSGNEYGGRAVVELLAEELGWEQVRQFPIRSAADCIAAAEALDPLQQEGFVVVDNAYRRVKIKSPRYVILHHLKGEATPRRAVELWQTGETSELLSHFPEMAPAILEIQLKLDDVAQRAANEHDEAKCRSFDRKSYASMATRYPFSAVMFRMLTDGVEGVDAAKAIMRASTTASLERLVTP
jgi:hypothetical protein